MVSTCVDSALNELTELERNSSLLETMKSQIQKLQLDLGFLKMLFWCCESWDDAAKDVLMGSNMGRIGDTLRRAGKGLYATGGSAILGVRSEKWDLICANLLGKVEQLNPQISCICLDLLDRSLQCTYSTSQEILEFIGAILKNLKEFLKDKANIISPHVGNQIRALEEILSFLRNFVSVTERGIVMFEDFQDFWNLVQTHANNAACVLFLYWVSDQMDQIQMDETMAHRMNNIFSNPLRNIKPCAEELTGMYLGVLKASEPALSDPVMTSEVVAGCVDLLLQYLPVSMKTRFPILREGLVFLVSFLVHPPKDTSKGKQLFTEADAVLKDVASFICSQFSDRINEDMGEARHKPLLDFLERVGNIKAKVKELHVRISNLPVLDFPKTNGVGFIEFFVENLKEMLEFRNAFLKPFEKEKIALILEELRGLKVSFERWNEEMEIKDPWMRILNATYKAEHVIDCLRHSPIWYSMICLSDVIEEIKNIKTDVERMEDELKCHIGVLAAKMDTCHISNPAQDKISAFSDNTDAVGFDDEAGAIIDLLLGPSTELQVVSIVGMPGIGKTTLAHKVYNHDSVKRHFQRHAWCSISRAYRSEEVLLGLLECLDSIDDRTRDLMKEDLVDLLRKRLLGCRYLIVIDDIREMAVWDDLKASFDKGNNGSRILFTSQIHNVASETQLPFRLHHLQPLPKCKSWELFQAKLPLNGDCSSCLLEVGQQIVQKCNGLPLAIVVIAGLLSRKDKNLDLWNQIDQNLSSFMDTNERYKEILLLSYKHLPDPLKPFFLYFGAFQEDKAVSVQKLIQLWVAEGFVRKVEDKANVEDKAKQHLKDLITRSLVIVTNRGSNGEIKACRMHSLLREFCVAKVEQESFFKLLHIDQSSSNIPNRHLRYRLCIHGEWLRFFQSKPTGPHVRSLLFSPVDSSLEERHTDSSFLIRFRLLRVLNLEGINLDGSFPTDIIRLVHLRYLAVWGKISEVPSSIDKLWSLETFVVKGSNHKIHLPNTIWNMKRLRHINVNNISLSGFGIEESSELEVETFGTIHVSCREEAKELLRRLPKVRRLRCILSESRNSPRNDNQIPDFSSNLESLNVHNIGAKLNLSEMQLPETLQKLTLSQCGIPWSQISILGGLPNLQILKLHSGAFLGEAWDLDENKFPELKFLKLFRLDIAILNASACDSYPFPKLEGVVVEHCSRLVAIPSILGEINTLQKIEIRWCSKEAAASARNLHEEYEHLDVLINS